MFRSVSKSRPTRRHRAAPRRSLGRSRACPRLRLRLCLRENGPWRLWYRVQRKCRDVWLSEAFEHPCIGDAGFGVDGEIATVRRRSGPNLTVEETSTTLPQLTDVACGIYVQKRATALNGDGSKVKSFAI